MEFFINQLKTIPESGIYIFLAVMPVIFFIFFLRLVFQRYFELNARGAILKTERKMFEIRTPKEIEKTPLAMELVLTSLFNTGGEGNWYDRNIKGKRRKFFSLEIVSDGGNIKFYIWIPKDFRKIMESAFYAQYPSVELIEVKDYTKFQEYDKKKQSMFGIEYGLKKEDPYPIKTYKEFGLDKPGLKPEEINDPMSNMLEVMGNIGVGEKIWVQMVLRGQKKDSKSERYSFFDILKERKFKKDSDWTKEGEELVKKITEIDNVEGKKVLDIDSLKKTADSIIINIGKPGFWTGIRSIYISEKDNFNPENISALASIFNSVKSEFMNSLSPKYATDFDYPWNDYKGVRIEELKKEIFADYKRRKYFVDSKEINPHYFLPFLNKQKKYNDFILSTEELATIFHLPSTAVSTPTFVRAESKKGEAPVNLPF